MAAGKALQALLDNALTAKFAQTLKYSDLPDGWSKNKEIVKLAEDAYKEAGTESPFFKAWFGRSKVVDDAGNPQVVYHGTNAYDLKKFKPGSSGYLGGGIYTTPEKWKAQLYTDYGDEGIHELYQRMERPYTVKGVDSITPILGDLYGDKAAKEYAKRRDKVGGFESKILTKSDAKKIADRGYDGIRWEIPASVELSTLDPTSVKAVRNRGTFDPNDSNIYKGILPIAASGGAVAALSPDEAEAAPKVLPAAALVSTDGSNAPVDDGMLRQFLLGTRGVLEGAGGVADYIRDPLNWANGALGGDPEYFKNPGEVLADAIRLPVPENETERGRVGLNHGVSGALAESAAGGGIAKYGAGKAAEFGKFLEDSPILNGALGGLMGYFYGGNE